MKSSQARPAASVPAIQFSVKLVPLVPGHLKFSVVATVDDSRSRAARRNLLTNMRVSVSRACASVMNPRYALAMRCFNEDETSFRVDGFVVDPDNFLPKDLQRAIKVETDGICAGFLNVLEAEEGDNRTSLKPATARRARDIANSLVHRLSMNRQGLKRAEFMFVLLMSPIWPRDNDAQISSTLAMSHGIARKILTPMEPEEAQLLFGS